MAVSTSFLSIFRWKFLVFSVLVILCFTMFVYCENGNKHHRVKRKVLFTKSSKFFFRLNGKENMINKTDIWAHGWGFRINYDLPHSIPKRHQFFKRDVHSDIANIEDPIVLKILHCLVKPICDILSEPLIDKHCGMFCGVAKIIARSQGLEADFFKSFSKKCEEYKKLCPEGPLIFGFG